MSYDLVRAAGPSGSSEVFNDWVSHAAYMETTLCGRPVGRRLIVNSTTTPNCDTCADRLAPVAVCKWCLAPADAPRHDFVTPGNFASAKHDFDPR